jgi:hypothetical protein
MKLRAVKTEVEYPLVPHAFAAIRRGRSGGRNRSLPGTLVQPAARY